LYDYHYYVDAIGFSWDSNYDIGDNKDEGLILSFKTPVHLDSIKYSLDAQSPIEILGNTTIPFPGEGEHTIQICGSNFAGDILQSELRYFTIDSKSPEITIHFPNQSDSLGIIAPRFYISVDEANLISTWYTIDDGINNISIREFTGYIDQEAWLTAHEGPITIKFYARDILDNIAHEDIVIIKEIVKKLYVNIIDQSFSSGEFNITIYVCNESNIGIYFASIRIYWNWIDVSTDIQNLGSGLYFIPLEPITVAPDEEPIVLSMTVSAIGYEDKYFETYLAVDPDTLQKGKEQRGVPLLIILVIISISSSGVLIGTVIILWLRKRKIE